MRATAGPVAVLSLLLAGTGGADFWDAQTRAGIQLRFADDCARKSMIDTRSAKEVRREPPDVQRGSGGGMGMRTTVALLAGATAIVAGGVSIGAVQKPTLTSGERVKARVAPIPPLRTPAGVEPLFRGDMVPEIGLGCSDGTGSSGGPNDWATKVTATLPPQPEWGVVSTTYNIFTFNSGPTWNLNAWQNGAIPGAVIASCPLGAGAGTVGNHTIAVPLNCLNIPAAAGPTFFFGLSQGADTNGVRIGQDTNGAFAPATVYIRAPGCGLAGFGSVESIGYPGNWVHRIMVDNSVPVELMDVTIS